jgi:hypothetical protein
LTVARVLEKVYADKMQYASRTPGYVYGFYATGIMAAGALVEYLEQDATYLRTLSIAFFIGSVSVLKRWWAKKHPRR